MNDEMQHLEAYGMGDRCYSQRGEDVSRVTESARGMPCTMRLPEVCNFNPETTVWAHMRSIRYGAGVGIKPKDFPGIGLWACSSCHAVLDGHVKTAYEREWVELQAWKGVGETAARMDAAGWRVLPPEKGLLDAYEQTDADYRADR